MVRLKKWILAAMLALSWIIFSLPATGAEPAGEQIWMNRAFRFGSYDFRIIRVEWLRANGYLVPLGQPDSSGRGAVVLTVVLRNAGKTPDHLPTPDIAVALGDGNKTTTEARFPYDVTGKRLGLDVYAPGEGSTVRYIIASVPQPTAGNPITKITFSPRNSGDGGPGILRLYNPPVSISN